MKNADKPSAPFKEVISMQGGVVTRYDNHKGLTKREHFAAMAMQSCWHDLTDGSQPQHYDYAAKSCVAMADAMLAELERTK